MGRRSKKQVDISHKEKCIVSTKKMICKPDDVCHGVTVKAFHRLTGETHSNNLVGNVYWVGIDNKQGTKRAKWMEVKIQPFDGWLIQRKDGAVKG